MHSVTEVKSRAIVTVLQVAWHQQSQPFHNAFGAPPLDCPMHYTCMLQDNYAEALLIQSSLILLPTNISAYNNTPFRRSFCFVVFLLVAEILANDLIRIVNHCSEASVHVCMHGGLCV